jgi:hypothetical protein
VNYLNPKFANLSFGQLLKLAQPRSSSSPSLMSAGALPDDGAKISSTDPLLRSIAFGRPSRRTTTVPSGSSGSGILAGVASSLFSGSLIGSLASLFGSSSGQTTRTLSLFQLPESTSASLVTGGANVSQPSSKRPYSVQKPQAGVFTGGGARTYSTGVQSALKVMTSSRGGASAAGSGHQIHIHVSALDTQSFLDRSSHIAQAVKTAMLQSNSLNDVIAEM